MNGVTQRHMSARLQPTSSTFVELAPVDSGYARRIARWPKPAGFLFCGRKCGETLACSARLNASVPFQHVRSKFVSCWNISKHPNLYYCTDLSVRPSPLARWAHRRAFLGWREARRFSIDGGLFLLLRNYKSPRS